jgi:hypothetical protein
MPLLAPDTIAIFPRSPVSIHAPPPELLAARPDYSCRALAATAPGSGQPATYRTSSRYFTNPLFAATRRLAALSGDVDQLGVRWRPRTSAIARAAQAGLSPRPLKVRR